MFFPSTILSCGRYTYFMLTFEELGLSEASLSALGEKGFIYPTPIQEQVIPALLTGSRDIIGQAQTGTGKTAAFALPILDGVDTKDRAVQALVLVPTRELAVQVAAEIDSLTGSRKIFVEAVYGGQSIERQFRALQRGVHIVVGTPGRVLDHLRRRSLDLSDLSFLVLDEADEMLDRGFLEDIEEVIEASHPDRRMLLFSATMPERIVKIARSHMKEFSVVNVKGKNLTISLTSQKYIEVKAQDKVEVLRRCIDMEEDMHALVFCRTRVETDETSRALEGYGYAVACIHGEIGQSERERILKRFRSGSIAILVATDVAARGLDIPGVTHVFNFSLPQTPEEYVHRIGRTGRAGKEGVSVTFITPSEYSKLMFIKRIVKADIEHIQIPSVKDILDRRMQTVFSSAALCIETEDHERFHAAAEALVAEHDPATLVAGLLSVAYGKGLSPSSYRPVAEVKNIDSYHAKRCNSWGEKTDRGQRFHTPYKPYKRKRKTA